MDDNHQSQSPKLERPNMVSPILTPISVTFDNEIVDLTLPSPRLFPEPQDEVYRPVFRYIEEKLWPLWTEGEKLYFERHIAPKICLTTKHPTKERFLGRPSDIGFVSKASGLVDITVAFAIWGRGPLEQRPNFARVIARDYSQLALFPDGPAPGFGQPLQTAKINETRRITLQTKRRSTAFRSRARTHSNTYSRSISNHETVGDGALTTPRPSLDVDMVDWAARPQRHNRQHVNYADTDGEVESDIFAPADEPVGCEPAQHQQVANDATESEDPNRNIQGVLAEKEALEKIQADLRTQFADIAKLFYSEAHMTILAFEGIKYEERDEEQVKRVKRVSDNLKSMFSRAQQWIDGESD